ncbi:GH92 family glycosyl hydrolase [Pinibacter soli]|uniref:GH92 family glycosyl hydrolase n=1 Tax=Pinibacter soli TaxID=3044211 RepID=A0ABT6RB64_9BACT|nr:GH92 family glycosyl hydrolase [Pinibacter soli]MDI3319809.1 GH92 family glycosyl hydrolase [Pinibacter soli]
MMKFTLIYIALFFLSCQGALSYAGPGNIAPLAKVVASSNAGIEFSEKNVIDGIIGVDGKGEWACKGETANWGYIKFPWIQLSWDEPQWIDKVVLFDRVSLQQNISGVKLLFSDGSIEWVNQLPSDGTGLAVKFTPRKTKWIKFEVTDGTGSDLGFSEIEVYPSVEGAKDYVSLVNPYIETNKGRYEYFITGSLPFGMATSAPLTRDKHQVGGGYNYNEKEILGFQQIHTWMMSGIEIMPATTQENPFEGRNSWKSSFNHDDEIVQPGYHRVMLQKNKIWVEQTATDRVSFYRFQYTKKSDARVVIDMGSTVKNVCTMVDARIDKVSNTEIEGSFSTVKRFWGGPNDIRVFFVIQFDKPFTSLDVWQGDKTIKKDISHVEGDSVKLGAEYVMQAGEQLNMKIAISYTSVENAKNNLAHECTTWNFDEVRNNAAKIWNQYLGRIEAKGGTPQQRQKFYTDLWHVLLGRQKINDVNGDYPDRTEITKFGGRNGKFNDAVFKIKSVPKDENGRPKFNMYLSDAFWLTQWNLNVLWGLAWPELMDDFSASLLEYAKNGKLLPRAPMGGGYTFIMTGDPAASFIVSTYMKGLLKKVDANTAFEIVKENQMPGGMISGGEMDRGAAEFYIKNGWWPNNAGVTIEAGFQDWGAAQMAAKLGRENDYNLFRKRASGWTNCFDTVGRFIFPKDKNGKFTHTNPLSGAGWVESNAWQATWGVSHDITKLIDLIGGRDSFCNKLNFAFEKAKEQDFVDDYSSGYISYGNQPGCSNAHLFSYAGKPWLTQYWVRQVQQQTYGGTTPDAGYGGHDEDEGQMGGISALMSIGLFDIMGNEAQQPVYEITSPLFDEITIHLNQNYYEGESFVIKCYNNSSANKYIQSAKLNRSTLKTFWFTHNDFSKGGQLELWMGDKPNHKWGVAGLPPACN